MSGAYHFADEISNTFCSFLLNNSDQSIEYYPLDHLLPGAPIPGVFHAVNLLQQYFSPGTTSTFSSKV
jgi:hypothetical protein